MADEGFKTADKWFETANTGVFWDADVCKIPAGLNAVVVSQNIRSALKRLNYRGEVSIFAYGDSKKIMDGLDSGDTSEIQGGMESTNRNEIIQAGFGFNPAIRGMPLAPVLMPRIQRRQYRPGSGGGDSDMNPMVVRTPVNVVKQTITTFDYRGTSIYATLDTGSTPRTPTLCVNHTSPGDKDGRLQRILTDLMCWPFDNPAPANVMLVLGDDLDRRKEFKYALNRLILAGYNIHFAYPQKAPGTKNYPVDTKWLWESLSIGGTPLKDKDKRYSLRPVDETSVVSGNPLLRSLVGWSAFVGAIAAMLLH